MSAADYKQRYREWLGFPVHKRIEGSVDVYEFVDARSNLSLFATIGLETRHRPVELVIPIARPVDSVLVEAVHALLGGFDRELHMAPGVLVRELDVRYPDLANYERSALYITAEFFGSDDGIWSDPEGWMIIDGNQASFVLIGVLIGPPDVEVYDRFGIWPMEEEIDRRGPACFRLLDSGPTERRGNAPLETS